MKYSVSELERMREAIRGAYPTGISFRETERSADIERRLTTYMSNGTTADELEEYARKIWEARLALHKELELSLRMSVKS